MARHDTGFRKGEIETHHSKIQACLSQHLVEAALIVRPENWHRRADKAEITFDLIGTGRAERATRKRGVSHPVVAGKERANWWDDYDASAWISWHEEWISIRAQTFELKAAGLTLFWGPPEDKRQIIRAEWAQPPKHGGDGGQPHWHVDFDEIIGGLSPAEAGHPVFGISLTDCHLAMAGWQCVQIQGKPWHSRVGEDLGTLSHWADMTLEYISRQLTGCRRPRSW